MMSEVDSIVLIPTSHLMCDDRDFNSVLTDSGPLHIENLDIFFDIVEDAFERWCSVVGSMAPGIYADYHKNQAVIERMHSRFEKLFECDDESVFHERAVLNMTLGEFQSLMAQLANAFVTPKELREFYLNIASRLLRTFEDLVGGDV